MSFQVMCRFDLKGASSQDYTNAYEDLAKLGLKKVHASTSGNVVIPTTTVMGTYDGGSAEIVRDHVRGSVRTAFSARRFKSEIFVAVGGSNHTWGSATT